MSLVLFLSCCLPWINSRTTSDRTTQSFCGSIAGFDMLDAFDTAGTAYFFSSSRHFVSSVATTEASNVHFRTQRNTATLI